MVQCSSNGKSVDSNVEEEDRELKCVLWKVSTLKSHENY